ncbi:MAG TPA: terminase, partial [Gemmataceae bacterium]|nr:terminase [Gemmataceae bacterium]
MRTKQMTASDYNAVLRLDFSAFLQRTFYELNPGQSFFGNWHLDLIASRLEDCRNGRCRRLIINVPPRTMKSQMASVAFPAFWLGHDPTKRIICVSYGQDLANTHAMSTRTLMNSPFYRGVFGNRLSPEKQSVGEFMTPDLGFRLATSVGGVLTGRGADVIIIDDPLKPDEALSDTQRKNVNEWYSHTLYSRLNDKANGVIILIMQRLHLDDLVGHVLTQEKWEVLSLPAIATKEETFIYTS